MKLYRPLEGKREFTGLLENYQDGNVTVDGRTFEKKDVAQVRLHADF